MTTATSSPFSYVHDPGGLELRRALLVPAPPTTEVEPAVLVLAGAATLTLLAGVLRVALG